MEKHQTESQSSAVSEVDQKTEAEKKSSKKLLYYTTILLGEKKSRKLDTNKS